MTYENEIVSFEAGTEYIPQNHLHDGVYTSAHDALTQAAEYAKAKGLEGFRLVSLIGDTEKATIALVREQQDERK